MLGFASQFSTFLVGSPPTRIWTSREQYQSSQRVNTNLVVKCSLVVIAEKYFKLHSSRRLAQFWHISQKSLVALFINCTPSRMITYTYTNYQPALLSPKWKSSPMAWKIHWTINHNFFISNILCGTSKKGANHAKNPGTCTYLVSFWKSLWFANVFRKKNYISKKN